ncbi:MAG: pyridoxal-phosphate dependent enzyme [Phycisphaerales bacterium]|nr:pyridoxal-phosphate dependent enzyme [Phycisphaerales bacterium]
MTPTAQKQAAVDAPPVFGSVLEMIGATPMLELKQMDTGPCRLFVKLENQNPAGSIKDRIGLSMIEAAERDGRLDPNAKVKPTIIEATAGNTGLGLALVAGQRGYTLKVVVPDKMSEGKIQHLRAMGAEVILARSDVQKGHPDYYQEVAARLAANTPNSLFINQFCNPDNIRAHYETTAPEIWKQMEPCGGVDAFVVGVGSGGTLSGCAKYLKEQNPDVQIILCDPAGSILEPLVNRDEKVEPGAWLVEGMGEDFVPDICDIELADEAIAVPDGESFRVARRLLRTEGILGGSSTGCLIAAAEAWCKRQTKPMNVVTFVCDQGSKYLGKMFNDFWMIDNGFIKRERSDDLRDLIARRHELREDYTLKPTDPVSQAIKAMELHGISQLAVLDGNTNDVVGILDESDVLMAVLNASTSEQNKAMAKPVSEFMTTRLETIAPSATIDKLLPIFRADRVAIVVDPDAPAGHRYLGLITRIDLIHYLRRQMK